MRVELLAYTPNPVQVIEQAASTCYDSEPTPDGKIMKACYRNGHHSVLEHASFTYCVSGVSRALLAQLTRHRTGISFSVRSQRYCKEDAFGYVTPPSIAKNETASRAYSEVMNTLSSAYTSLIGLGIPAEDARFILPNACETTITFTVNLRELIHICRERLCTRAQWEIRQMVQLMAEETVKVFPECADMLKPKCEADLKHPFCPEAQCCGRHKKLSEVYKK